MKRPITALVLAVLALGLSACGNDDPATGAAPGPTSTPPSTTSSSPDAGPETSPAPSPVPSPVPSPATSPRPDDLQYVALGDSYAAAPGVPTSDAAGGCFRSDHNYAHLVAAADPSIFLTDVTCSGATSDDVIAKQVPALSRDTDLVTVGIGGNDFGLFTRVLLGCLGLGGAGSSDAPCRETAQDALKVAGPKIEVNLGRVLDAIVAAAPDAQVLVISYPALLPDQGSCADLAPLAAKDYPIVAGINEVLADALRDQAEQRDLTYVDVYGASAGHDVCSDDPWVNGRDFAADGTIPFHPFAEEQAAVASMIEDVL